MEEDCLFYVIDEVPDDANSLLDIASRGRTVPCKDCDTESMVKAGYYGAEVKEALEKYENLVKKARDNSLCKIYKYVQNL